MPRQPTAGPSQVSASDLSRPWVLVAGAVFGAMTLLFLMGLVLSGKEIPCSGRFPFAMVISFGAALAVSFIGGSAAASGTLGVTKESAFKFTAAGGIAVLIIMMFLTSRMYVESACKQPPWGQCPDITGAWRRTALNDGVTYRLESDGCKLVGDLKIGGVDHKIAGTFKKDPIETVADVRITRRDERTNCTTVMNGTLWPWPYGDRIDGIRMRIYSTDGQCPPWNEKYSEDYFYIRQ
jgi:hypothetical protein